MTWRVCPQDDRCHSAAVGHFLSTRGDAFQPRQFDRTFNYLAHSFAYWTQTLHELDLLAPHARILGLTNVLQESLLHNCGLIAAAKAALEMYVRLLAMELGPLGHRVNLPPRRCSAWRKRIAR
jgi:enoyl-[acyl-carrier protein] reductase III